MASQNGHVEVADKLLNHGATVDLPNMVRFTFIYLLCFFIMPDKTALKRQSCSILYLYRLESVH